MNIARKKVVATIGVGILLALGVWIGQSWFDEQTVGAQPQVGAYIPIQILQNQRLNRPLRARIVGGNYYILDAFVHRVVVLDSAERFIRQVGRLGSGPQELSDPTDFAIGRDGKIYIFEAGNKRLTILNSDGSRVGGFSAPELSLGVVVNSKNEIILNQPAKDSLFTVNLPDGTVKRAFGELRTPPSGFGPHPHADRKESYNRVSFALDSADNIYAAWWFEPRVQKYTAEGQLVWDIELAGKQVNRSKDRAQQNKGYYKYNGASLILSGIAYDASSNLVYVLFPNRTLYVLNRDGQKLAAFLDIRENVWPFRSITVAENGKLLFTDSAEGVWSIAPPKP